ncbi:MAG: hypothetical protein IPJ65_40645 [Archangiaceae bacterium]|nr:hypothetical protein [Archangiaceae bacterium]
MVPTDATYFYMTDQRATDRTAPVSVQQLPKGTASSSTPLAWKYTREKR